MSINKVILVGNVGKDPEVRHLENNVSVANFTLATSENYTNKSGEKVTTTEWHNIVCWRGLATLAENYIKKGSQLYIEGRIRTRSFDGQDGTKKYTTEIFADTVQLLGKKGESGHVEDNKVHQATSEVKEPQSDAGSYSNNGNSDDDLPF
jgi:single-strand DNA-binding protein